MPSLLTNERADRIVTAVEHGNTVTAAAQAAGIGRSTLLGYLDRGRKERARLDANHTLDHEPDIDLRRREQPYSDLLDRVEIARAAAETHAVDVIHEAFNGWDEVTTVEVSERDSDLGVLVVTKQTVTTVRRFSWQAAAWWLERTRNTQYGRVFRNEIVDPDADATDEEPIEEMRARALALVDEVARKRAQRDEYHANGESASNG